jgi:glycosyltransferase involved in cell wall biosynthesis
MNNNINKIIVVGPFASEYSLAKVNRNLGFALQNLYPQAEIGFVNDSKSVDRQIKSEDFKKYPQFNNCKIYSDYPNDGSVDLLIYNNFPRSIYEQYGLIDYQAKLKVAYLAWEESVFPEHFVTECNKQLHAMFVTSEHVAKVFRYSGVSIPIINISEGIDHILEHKALTKYNLNTTKKFKFLHISSAQKRKGVDVLIDAYLNEFNNNEDVSLILKIFPNYDSQISEALAKYDKNIHPEIILIEDGQLSDQQILSIYNQCNCLVAPSRAEGFGLPMAEAMALGLPLITTRYSGQLDFCNEDNCLLIDYKLQKSDSHLEIPNSLWAEPDVTDLQKNMRYIFENIDSQKVKNMIDNAKKISINLKWSNTANKLLENYQKLSKITALKSKKIGIMSSWNTKCGIAEYSNNLYSLVSANFQYIYYFANHENGDRVYDDENNVIRCWDDSFDINELSAIILKYNLDIIHIQYNPSFYNLAKLADLVNILTTKNDKLKVYLTLHSVQLPHLDFRKVQMHLAKATKIFVHNDLDQKYLEKIKYTNVNLIPIGLLNFTDINKYKLRAALGINSNHIIASHGLIHENKGLLELFEAIKIVKSEINDILLLAINAYNPNNLSSADIYLKLKNFIKENNLENNIILFDEFLPINKIIKLIQLSDMAIFPYPQLNESASGAIRTAIAAKRPIILTKSHIFHDISVGYKIDNNNPNEIAKAITDLYSNSQKLENIKSEVTNFANENIWEKISLYYLAQLVG